MRIDISVDMGEGKGNLYLTEDEARELWKKLNSFFGHTPPYYYPTPTYPWITTTGTGLVPTYTTNGTSQDW